MPADWLISCVEHRNAVDILGWNLENPTAGPETAGNKTDGVRFRGWFLAEGGPGRIIVSQGGVRLAEHAADLPRPDVANARVADPAMRAGKERCGFDLTVPLRPGPYRLEARGIGRPGAESPVMIFDILDRNCGPYALIGANGHLFLGGDSNDSIGQFIEDRVLSESSAASWAANFGAMKQWESEFGLRIAFLVAPAKEEIFPEFYPFPRARRTVLDDFRRRFTDSGAIVPLHALRSQRHFAYCETDTHWTDCGATRAARAVLESWAMDEGIIRTLPSEFRLHQRQGDLGVKLEPRRASYELVFAYNLDKFLVFDNGVANQGCLRLWRNPHAPLPGGCVIFGDSFGTNFAQSLTTVFREVAYVYRPAAFDPLLVGLLRPSYVILQITQRFLHGSPDRRSTVFDTAATKILALAEPARRAAIDRLRAQTDGPLANLARPHLERL